MYLERIATLTLRWVSTVRFVRAPSQHQRGHSYESKQKIVLCTLHRSHGYHNASEKNAQIVLPQFLVFW